MRHQGLARKQSHAVPRRPAALHLPQIGRPPAGLQIGLLNNMPDSAFLQTEQQFRRLIGPDVTLKLFSLEGLARGEAVQAELGARYQTHHALKTAGLDALVITGSEPIAPQLQDEPFFGPLSDVIAWAEANIASTLLSCLASHAAVLARSGITRRPLGRKCSGVFACSKTQPSHPLLAGLPETVPVPHSRWNGLAEAELCEAGYAVLRSSKVGVDLFIDDRKSLLVFLQGHPEYDADSLAREYRRDVGRFLDGTRVDYPAMPENCFSAEGAALLARFAGKASTCRDPALSAEFPKLDITLPAQASWQEDAAQLFRNWLRYVAQNRVTSRTRMAV